MQSTFEIRQVFERDLPLLTEWASRPHVSRWFGGEGRCLVDLNDHRIAMWIAMLDSRAFAYIQDYDIHGWPGHHFDFLPPGSRGIDLFIGDSGLTGLGYGSKLLLQHADALIGRNVPALGIDPHPDNHAAIRANQKAGFTAVSAPTETRWGRVILMTRSLKEHSGQGPPASRVRAAHPRRS
jgi:aminoglycoside 6'-N-acetyltransferase